MAYGQVSADVISTSVANSSLGAGNATLMKNKIINGQMVIDQRNAGASITVSVDNQYDVDRFSGNKGGSINNYTLQQSTTAPVGFVNSMIATMGTGVTVGATDYAFICQRIEGYNIADLGWGTADAKATTLSFWVRSSVTGTFGVSFRNNAANATYCATYTITSANTFEYKTVSIPAITSGTWTTNNTTGVMVAWDLGVGSTFSGTAGQLNTGANYFGVTGTTKLAATTGATFYITGVQLEVGSSATGYEYRQYGQELQLCQRYCYQVSYNATGGTTLLGAGVNNGTTDARCYMNFPVTMRASPTVTASSGSNYYAQDHSGFIYFNSIASAYAGPNSTLMYGTTTGGVAGYGIMIYLAAAGAYVNASAEL